MDGANAQAGESAASAPPPPAPERPILYAPSHLFTANLPFTMWWRRSVVASVDHARVIARVFGECGLTARFIFMTLMSAGIAVLGLLLSSPAVVIGAMLISPLMNPILGLGFSLALFDFTEMRRSLVALAAGSGAAVLFTAMIVLASPLKASTTEILARTRPSLFDLAVALFAALAGTFAIIRGRGETIVGVAIATALMPPLAVVGYGMATGNMPVFTGSLALFVTNFVTIALSATVMARLYGFGHSLSPDQSRMQTAVLLLVFIAMAVPLGFSLRQIANEAVAASQIRTYLVQRFGDRSRVTQLDVSFDEDPWNVRSVVIAPGSRALAAADLQAGLEKSLGRRVKLQVDQVLLGANASAIEAQREELRLAQQRQQESEAGNQVAQMLAIAAGSTIDRISIDREHRRISAAAAPLPGATLETYRQLESRIAGAAGNWTVVLTPPAGNFPEIRFANNEAELDEAAKAAVALSAWAARRWNVAALGVPGLAPPDVEEPRTLTERRAAAIAKALSAAGVGVRAAPASGATFRLAPAAEQPGG